MGIPSTWLLGLALVAAPASPQTTADSLLPALGKAMGLAPRHHVNVVFHDAASLRQLLLDAMARQYPGDAFDRMSQAYQLIGLVPQGTNLRTEVLQTLQGAIAGTYDPFSGQMALVQGTPAERAGELLQHELAHALQDQYFTLKTLIRRAAPDEDVALALQGVIEGQAVVAMFTGGATQAGGAEGLEGGSDRPEPEPATEAERLARARADLHAAGVEGIGEDELKFLVSGGAAGAGGQKTSWSSMMPQEGQIPSHIPWLRAQTAFPYQEGTRFIESLIGKASFPAVITSTFGRLPTSTKQVMHPEAYAQHIEPTPVRLPGLAKLSGWRVVYRNTVGELNIRTLFGGAGVGDTLAAGWMGDGIVGLQAGEGDMAVVWASVWESGQDAAEFAAAMSGVMASRPGNRRAGPDKFEAGSKLSYVLRDKNRVAVVAGVPRGREAAILERVWEQ